MRVHTLAISLLLASAAAVAEPMASLEESEHMANLKELERLKGELQATIAAIERQLPTEPERGKSVRSTGGGKIVNGVLTSAFPAAGAVLRGADPDSASPWCTGTLIGCRTFLTAAHCTQDHFGADVPKEEMFVFFQHAGIYEVEKITRHSGYTKAGFPDKDIALLQLARDVDGVQPVTLNPATVPGGTPGLIVGFGRTGGFAEDYGIKRRGIVRSAACQNDLPGGMLCWDFNAPVGRPGEDSNTCNADSGGPLFVQALDASIHVAGVTSGGSQSACLAGDHSYDTDVFSYLSWIRENAESELGGGACGSIAVDGDDAQIFAESGELDPGRTSQEFQVPFSESVKQVRVALNGEGRGDGAIDFDLVVRNAGPAGAAGAECSRTGPGQFAYCEIEPEGAGLLSVDVVRKRGSGLFQLTATALGR